MILHGQFKLAFSPLGKMPWVIYHLKPDAPSTLHPVPVGAHHVTTLVQMTTVYDRAEHHGWFHATGVLSLHHDHAVIALEPYDCAKCKAKQNQGCYCDA